MWVRGFPLPPSGPGTAPTRTGDVAMPRRLIASGVRRTDGTGDCATDSTDAGWVTVAVAAGDEQAAAEAATSAAAIMQSVAFIVAPRRRVVPLSAAVRRQPARAGWRAPARSRS